MRMQKGFVRLTSLGLILTMIFSFWGGAITLATDTKVVNGSLKQTGNPLADYLDQGLTVANAKAMLAQGAYSPNSLLIKLESGQNIAESNLSKGQVVSEEKLMTLGAGCEAPGIWYRLDLKTNLSLEDMATLMVDLSGQQTVLNVSPNYKMSLPKTIDEGNAQAVAPGAVTSVEGLDIDGTTFFNQSFLQGFGIQEGWDIMTKQGIKPGQGVVVAVVDSGVDYNHPDLRNQILRQKDDSIWGYDFYNDDADPMDDNKHGTHVSGIIAAERNDFGVVGVSYGAKIMPVKVLSGDGMGGLDLIVRGINYAVVQGADVINVSLGGGDYGQAITDALDLANQSGAILIAAAGNSGAPIHAVGSEPEASKTCFASYYQAIGVMAEGENPDKDGDRLAYYSNWDESPGDGWDYNLMAPGSAIASTCPDGTYRVLSGTSMAAPVVSGMAACLVSYVNKTGIEGHSKYSEVEKHNYVFSQITGSGNLEQGITYNSKKYSYPEANLAQMLTTKTKPELALVDYDDTIIGDMSDKLNFKLFNYHGTAENIKISVTSNLSGVTVKSPTDVYNITDSGELEFAVEVIVDDSVVTNKEIPLAVNITFENGKDSGDTRTYTLQKNIVANYYKAEVLSQEKLDKLTTLDNSKLWIISTNLLLKKGQSLTMTKGAQLLFLSQGSLDVAGKLEVRGMVSDPVYITTWGDYSSLTEADGGVINTDYLIIDSPLMAATNIKHTDVVGDDTSLDRALIVADNIGYCNFSKAYMQVSAQTMEYCQLNNIYGSFDIKNVLNNTIIPGVSFDEEAKKAIIPEFLNSSYSLDFAKLIPQIDGDKIYIAYPAPADQLLNQFITSYVELLGGKLVGNLKTDSSEGQRIEIDLGYRADSTNADGLKALYTTKVFGDKSENGFSQSFYSLLEKLNTFKNNAVLGAIDFNRDDKLPGSRYQLLLDNYWDLSQQELLTYLQASEKYQDLCNYYRDYENFFKAANHQYVFSFLADPPSDVPPYQVSVDFVTNGNDGSRYGAIAKTCTMDVYFNTQVLDLMPSLLSYSSQLYMDDNNQLDGAWRMVKDRSAWRGKIYFSASSGDFNFYNVSWAKDPWLTIEENSRYNIDMQDPISVDKVKSYANQTTISLKVYPNYDNRLSQGVYFYRYEIDPKTGKNIDSTMVQLNVKPIFAIAEGTNKGWYELEDSTAQADKYYTYTCAFAADNTDSEIFANMALDKRGNTFGLVAKPQTTKDGTTTVDLIANATSFYGLNQRRTFKVYYEDGMQLLSIVKNQDDGHKYLLSIKQGQDALGAYVLVNVDPAYNMGLQAGSLATITFKGEGNLTLR